jgi:hypothetical protein
MSGNDRSFHENLDLLIKLFKRLKEKTSLDEIQGIDKSFYQNFEYLINNYEKMKDQISEELLDKFGEPVKDMIAGLVEQLMNELGDDYDEFMDSEIELTEDDSQVLTGHVDDVDKIDEMLKDPNLSEDEINRLLDQRSKLKGN